MKIYIEIPLKQRVELEVSPSDTIQSVIAKIPRSFSESTRRRRLMFEGARLDEEETLSHYNIQEGSVLNLLQSFQRQQETRVRDMDGMEFHFRSHKVVKPVILMYDNEKKENEEITVNLKLNEAMDIGATYPHPIVLSETETKKEYEWKCHYSSDGSENACQLVVSGKKYDYLFWEGVCNRKEDFNGEVIGMTKENFVSEFVELLTKLGLNERESNDFIVYWLTKLSLMNCLKITICNKSYDDVIAPLAITGFEQIHRVMLLIEQVGSIEGLKNVAEVAPRQRPSGKYIIEWGAVFA